MPYAAGRKIPVAPQAEPPSVPWPFPAPTGGWVSAKNPASKMPFKTYGPTAEKLSAFFPTETGIEVMGGSQKHATVSVAGEPCESIWSYIGGAVRELFGASDGDIFNLTTPADPDVEETPDVTGQTSDYYSTQNFATAGGNFLYALNGTDSPELYNGTTWTPITGVSVPAITGVTTTGLSQVNSYRNRLFMVQGGTMNVWALPVDSLGGAAIQISLAGVFQLGGAVLFTATWSLDSGAGLDDKLVIMSTEGEIAVYQGSDPSDPTDWDLVGVYAAPKPLGKNGFTKRGGDLLILTEQGKMPITAALAKSKEELAAYMRSRNIAPDWIAQSALRKAFPWEIVDWPSKQRSIISNPVTGEESLTPPNCFIQNTVTGAWCDRPGWNTRCMALHEDFIYFGTNDGTVMQMEITGADDGMPYYPEVVFAWDHLGRQGFQKTIISARTQWTVAREINPQISASTDYTFTLPGSPAAAPDGDTPGEWDVGLWDVSLWDTGSTLVPYSTGWVSINASGFVHAMQIQLTIGNVATPRAKLITMDVLFEGGEIMLG